MVSGRTTNEHGFTLIEVLVATTLMLGVLTASLGALRTVENGHRKGSDRADVLSAARPGLERMTRELRQTATVYASPAPGPQSLTVSTYAYSATTGGQAKQDVTWSCSASVCTRSSGGRTTRVLSGVTNTDVFTYAPNATAPTYIGIKLVLALRGGGTATLMDGVNLRNQGTT